MYLKILFFTLLVLPLFGLLAEENSLESALRYDLFTEYSELKPGEEFYLGVHFQLAEGWHIYWKNPGESGLPTEITLESDKEGLLFGELLWPVPERFLQPGEIIGYGYKQEVLFRLPTRVKTDAEPGEYEITFHLRWLLCSISVCIPGRSTEKLTVRVAGDEILERSKKELPGSGYPFPEIVAEPFPDTVRVKSVEGEYKLSVDWEGDIKAPELFVYAPRGLKVEPRDLVHTGRRSELWLAVTLLEGKTVWRNGFEVLLVPPGEQRDQAKSVQWSVED